MKEVLATLNDISLEQFEIPKDILATIKADHEAWQNFQKFLETDTRIRIAFIASARHRPKEFQKRLNYFIMRTEKNKQFGFRGIDKYY